MTRKTVNEVLERLWNDSGDEEDISGDDLMTKVMKIIATSLEAQRTMFQVCYYPCLEIYHTQYHY